MQPGLLLVVAISLSAIMAFAWALERKTGKSGWIDAIWSFSVGAGSIIAVMFADATWQRRSVILILILAWSLRLGFHIAKRSMRHGEDPRYARLIKEWGENASVRLFWFLQIQALAAFILVVTVYLAVVGRPGFPYVGDMVGVAIIAIALIGEALSDAQLAQFRMTQKPKQKFAKPVFGLFPDIPTISLNGCSGARGRRWQLPDRHGVGCRCLLRSRCIGCWCMSPASLRLKNTC